MTVDEIRSTNRKTKEFRCDTHCYTQRFT